MAIRGGSGKKNPFIVSHRLMFGVAPGVHLGRGILSRVKERRERLFCCGDFCNRLY